MSRHYFDETSAPSNDWLKNGLLQGAGACGVSALARDFSAGLYRLTVGTAVRAVRGSVAIATRMFAAFGIGHTKILSNSKQLHVCKRAAAVYRRAVLRLRPRSWFQARSAKSGRSPQTRAAGESDRRRHEIR